MQRGVHHSTVPCCAAWCAPCCGTMVAPWYCELGGKTAAIAPANSFLFRALHMRGWLSVRWLLVCAATAEFSLCPRQQHIAAHSALAQAATGLTSTHGMQLNADCSLRSSLNSQPSLLSASQELCCSGEAASCRSGSDKRTKTWALFPTPVLLAATV
jgi:hypothetical protein